MNVNVSVLQQIKPETILYSVRINSPLSRWYEVKELFDRNGEMTVQQIIDGVNNKSRQISMRVNKATGSFLVQYSHLFKGIRKLAIEGKFSLKKTFHNNFPFHTFSNISHVTLLYIKLKRANFAFKNVIILEIGHCKIQEIVKIGTENENGQLTLRKLVLHNCEIQKLPKLNDIPSVTIVGCGLENFSYLGKRCEEFSYRGPKLEKVSTDILKQSFVLNSLIILKLVCYFAENVTDFSFCQHIPVVD
jgi:hypothetical protein